MPQPVVITDRTIAKLRRMNLAAAAVHLASGVAMLVLGNAFVIAVSSFNLNGPPGTPLSEGRVEHVFDVRLAWATAAFSLLSFVFHILVAVPPGSARYVAQLRQGRNGFRWVEYSLSATLMIVLIAMICGITDLAALVGIAFANAAMILFGWLMEIMNPPERERTRWSPFWFGCIAGAGPWVAIVAYIWVNVSQPGASGPPGFVYGILVSIFVLFNCFAVNQWLQYRGTGRWRDYLVGERTYIVLSLVAKVVLAWQIFANTLID
jgi:MFS family permease